MATKTSKELLAEAAKSQRAAKLAESREYETFGREIAKRFAPGVKYATDAISAARIALDGVTVPVDSAETVSSDSLETVSPDSDDETGAQPSFSADGWGRQ
ncbi:hypothetical protein [Leucobacter chinensis]|uniref:hypothetical protein n=1 Tax=Leucobacter chinensis TaxID=2851010 RepID=UPI001C211606|nr:hypothetical protein [Leucobacter chinensis]